MPLQSSRHNGLSGSAAGKTFVEMTSYSIGSDGVVRGTFSDDVQREIPIALPAIDARLRLDPPILGGKVGLKRLKLNMAL